MRPASLGFFCILASAGGVRCVALLDSGEITFRSRQPAADACADAACVDAVVNPRDAPADAPADAPTDAPLVLSECAADAGCEGGLVCDTDLGECPPRCAIDQCEVESACRPAGARNPNSPCRICDPAQATRAWSVDPERSPCEDGNFCTVEDRCDTDGICSGRPRDCEDGLACTSDRCDSKLADCVHEVLQGCAIGGRCVDANAPNPDQACQECSPAVKTDAWSPIDVSCDDGRACSHSDHCDSGGRCTGQPRLAGTGCPEGVCDGKGRCGGESIDVRSGHTCVISKGSLSCFGRNHWGQLGDGLTVPSAMPKRVGAEDDWTQVVVGERHTCGLRGSALYCWGAGQLAGAAETTRLLEPSRVGTAEDWGMLASGEAHVCGLRNAALFCWGSNGSGELGDGTREDRAAPTPVADAGQWDIIAAGSYHTCGLRQGALYCWGDNTWGQLGDGGSGDRLSPMRVGADAGWDGVAPGGTHTCGLRTGRLYCWGSNALGQFGQTTPDASAIPLLIGAVDDWVAVSCGSSHCCGIRAAGDLYCWGDASEGQIGGGTVEPSETPVALGNAWTAVAAGDDTTCGVRSGEAFCWGNGRYGQLGHVGTQALTPTRVVWP